MGLGGCYTCIRYLMFAFNFLFWLLGCAILGVGIWVRVDPQFSQYIQHVNLKELYTAAYILIAVGVIIMVLGFLGCCGAIRESQCMLVTFFIFLFVIFVVLLAAGIWAVVNKNSFRDKVNEFISDDVRKTKAGDALAEQRMDNLQESLKCCGAGSVLDYGLSPPKSCFEDNSKIPYTEGCTDKLFKFVSDNLLVVAGVAIGIGLVMLFGMIFSMMLCCSIRDTKG
ncbi:CD9 antigen-like [Lineus longissimus]|uniref:CD9 antigen-like n=1 Tax=Lineus longissimus TaxID=88925 RepID=UPI002B4D602F